MTDEDFLVAGLNRLNTGDDGVDWEPEDDYYVHIDVLQGSSTRVATRINNHMLENDAYDPRRAKNFPTDLMVASDRDTLKLRRQLAGGLSNTYYELWKVHKTFKLAEFREMVSRLTTGVKVRIVRMMGDDHDINIYPLEDLAASGGKSALPSSEFR